MRMEGNHTASYGPSLLFPMPQSPLEQLLAGFPSLLVAYSGGVDSSLLSVITRRVLGRDKSVAAIGISPALSLAQLEQARAIARDFDLNLVEIETEEFQNRQYVANSPDRCYFCKQELWSKLSAIAKERGIEVIADGMNVDDFGGHRPGLRASSEFSVRSPLAEAGYTKHMIRNEARALGIAIWNAPAAPCLSSRVLYGLTVTPERLRQIEQGERFLRRLGVEGDLRVRHRGDEARIEVGQSEFDRIRKERVAIAAEFASLGFPRVSLDLAGYREGSLLADADAEFELLTT